jgi:hypothetical protein
MAGNYLKPWESVNVPLLLRRPPSDRLTAPSGKAQGIVIDTADDTAQVATGQLLAISLGSADGISPGAVLSVYRTMYPSVPTSRNVVGEIAVVSAKEKTAWAKVTYSTDAGTQHPPRRREERRVHHAVKGDHRVHAVIVGGHGGDHVEVR